MEKGEGRRKVERVGGFYDKMSSKNLRRYSVFYFVGGRYSEIMKINRILTSL